jgi:hypothetical protein
MDVLFAVQSHPKPPFNSEEASHLQFDHDTRGSNERLQNKAKVKRCADRLKADKLVKPDRRGTLCLTEKGETEVKRLRAINANQ